MIRKWEAEELKEKARDARKALEQERERITEWAERMEGFLRVAEVLEEVVAENESLRAENETLRVQWQEERDRSIKREMQLKEMSKMTASVAGKASQDELLKAIKVFVNKSKRKKLDKRMLVKEMVLELANANSLVLPKELAATIDSLDDEQPEAKVLNVAGNYNDIHDNGTVEYVRE